MAIIHDLPQYSDEWWTTRLGLPTASVASQMVTSTGQPSKSVDSLAMTLAADKFAGKVIDSFSGNRYTDRGTELEPEARDAYRLISGRDVSEVGFVTDDLLRYGCSPDSVVGDTGLLEIKCQISKEHIKTLLYFRKHGKATPTYIPQCQMQLFVTGREYCDLFHYHPDLPSFSIRQRPIEAFQDQLKTQIACVLLERDRIVNILKEM